jgi:hypothetical protein
MYEFPVVTDRLPSSPDSDVQLFARSQRENMAAGVKIGMSVGVSAHHIADSVRNSGISANADYSLTNIFRFFVRTDLSSNHSSHRLFASSMIHTRSPEEPSLKDRLRC